MTTSVETAKGNADVLFTYAYSNGYDVFSRIQLSGRGVRHISGNNYHLTEAAADRIKATHSWVCDY